jgi:hypothetical protein
MHSVSREGPLLGNWANSDLESGASTNGRYLDSSRAERPCYIHFYLMIGL